jgi:hypothetical protein
MHGFGCGRVAARVLIRKELETAFHDEQKGCHTHVYLYMAAVHLLQSPGLTYTPPQAIHSCLAVMSPP